MEVMQMLVENIRCCSNCPVCGSECNDYKILNDGISPCEFWESKEEIYSGKYFAKYKEKGEVLEIKKETSKEDKNVKRLRDSRYNLMKMWTEGCDVDLEISKRAENRVYLKYAGKREDDKVRFCYDLDNGSVSIKNRSRYYKEDAKTMNIIRNQFNRYMERKINVVAK